MAIILLAFCLLTSASLALDCACTSRSRRLTCSSSLCSSASVNHGIRHVQGVSTVRSHRGGKHAATGQQANIKGGNYRCHCKEDNSSTNQAPSPSLSSA